MIVTFFLFFVSTESQAGCAVRKKYFLKIYEICSQFQNPENYSLKLKFLRDIPGKKLAEEFQKTFEKYGAKTPQDQKLQDEALAWMNTQNIAEGNILEFSFQNMNLESATVELKHLKGTETLSRSQFGASLPKSLSNIWLGPTPVDGDIKKALLN